MLPSDWDSSPVLAVFSILEWARAESENPKQGRSVLFFNRRNPLYCLPLYPFSRPPKASLTKDWLRYVQCISPWWPFFGGLFQILIKKKMLLLCSGSQIHLPPPQSLGLWNKPLRGGGARSV